MAYDTSKNSHWRWSVTAEGVWSLLHPFIKNFVFQMANITMKEQSMTVISRWLMCLRFSLLWSMTYVFSQWRKWSVDDWCVWGSCYGQWRKSVTDVLLEVKLTSVLPLCPAPTMRLATMCSIPWSVVQSVQSMTRVVSHWRRFVLQGHGRSGIEFPHFSKLPFVDDSESLQKLTLPLDHHLIKLLVLAAWPMTKVFGRRRKWCWGVGDRSRLGYWTSCSVQLRHLPLRNTASTLCNKIDDFAKIERNIVLERSCL